MYPLLSERTRPISFLLFCALAGILQNVLPQQMATEEMIAFLLLFLILLREERHHSRIRRESAATGLTDNNVFGMSCKNCKKHAVSSNMGLTAGALGTIS